MNDYLRPQEVEFFRGRAPVQAVACGHSHSAAIAGGELYMWGCNPDARLMIPDTENKLVPSLTLLHELHKEEPEQFEAVAVALGVTHSACITRSGEVFSAGSKLDG